MVATAAEHGNPDHGEADHGEARYEAAGLYDPAGDDAEDRLQLLEWLAGLGFTVEEMVDGLERDILPAMASDRRLLGGRLMTRNEALVSSGLDGDRFDEFVRALGFVRIHGAPDADVGYTSAEVEMLSIFGALTAMFSHQEALAFVRVIGASLSRVAEAGVALFLSDIENRMLESGRTELELGQAGYEAIGLIDGFMTTLDPVLRRHLQQATERFRRATISQQERYQYRYAVGFVDLVGFTGRSLTMEPRVLADFLRDFEARAHDAVTSAGSRIVKLIGDEVMFVGDDPSDVCRAAKLLMTGFGDEGDVVVPRGGVAYGSVLTRGGDYFGAVVNLASRLVDEAVPKEILVTQAVVDAAPERRFEPAGRRMVKGFADPVVVYSLAE